MSIRHSIDIASLQKQMEALQERVAELEVEARARKHAAMMRNRKAKKHSDPKVQERAEALNA